MLLRQHTIQERCLATAQWKKPLGHRISPLKCPRVYRVILTEERRDTWLSGRRRIDIGCQIKCLASSPLCRRELSWFNPGWNLSLTQPLLPPIDRSSEHSADPSLVSERALPGWEPRGCTLESGCWSLACREYGAYLKTNLRQQSFGSFLQGEKKDNCLAGSDRQWRFASKCWHQVRSSLVQC